MSTIAEIEAAIEHLRPDEVEELAAWLDLRRSAPSAPMKSVTGAELLAIVRAAEPLPEDVLSSLEQAQSEDLPPVDKWRD
jgi:hypothetical protein